MPSLPFNWLRGIDRIALLASLIAALIFWVSRPFPCRFILKAIPVLALALIVWHHQKSRQEITLFVALLFHTLGDVLLEIERVRLFFPAVGAFTLGHIFYILIVMGFLSEKRRHQVRTT
jgi:uncharacterized membrane protein YhhN